MTERSGPRRPVVTLQTAFSIVETLKESGGLTLDELTAMVPFAKSTVHRHLETLVENGYILKEGNTYRLSLQFLDLGIKARSHEDLFRTAKNRVDNLAIETGEKVWCVVEEHGQAVPIYGNSGENSVHSNISIGEHSLMHQLAAGKAILAHLPPERVDTIIDSYGLPSETDQTISDRDTLDKELEQIREKRVAFNREESGHQLHALGVPIRYDDNIAIGAISVSGPKRRLQGDLFTDDLPNQLLKIANDIEVDLLYS